MKVGVFIGGGGPESGGAYAFTRAVLDALEALESRHALRVLHTGFQGLVPTPRLPVTQLGVRGRRSITRRLLARIGVAVRREREAESEAEAEVDALGLHFVWFLGPATYPTTLPYAATVWDLAHRVEPAFPEVRTSGWRWDDREAHYRRWLPRAAYVVTGAAAGRDDIVRCYGVHPSRVRIFPLVASPLEPAGDGDAPDAAAPYLFYPAQFWPHKNHVGLLLAMHRLRERHGLRPRLVLSGGDMGNLAHVKATAASLGLEERVDFPGFVSARRLAALYRGATALVFPSFFGPDNLPPLEAHQAGCPVIAADVPGAREQLGDAALFVDPRDVESVADAMARMLREPELRRTLAERGHARAGRWTAAQYVVAMLGVIDEFETERRCWSLDAEYVHK